MDRVREGLLLEQFLEDIPDPQKDDGADDGADDLAIPLRPEGAGRADLAEQPAAKPAAEKTDDDVPDEPSLVFPHKEAGEPASDGSEEQREKNVNDVHGFVVIS